MNSNKRIKFRSNLYQAYIASGLQDPVLIQEYIEIAESFIFNSNKITVSGFRALAKKITDSNDHSNGSRALGKP